MKTKIISKARMILVFSPVITTSLYSSPVTSTMPTPKLLLSHLHRHRHRRRQHHRQISAISPSIFFSSSSPSSSNDSPMEPNRFRNSSLFSFLTSKNGFRSPFSSSPYTYSSSRFFSTRDLDFNSSDPAEDSSATQPDSGFGGGFDYDGFETAESIAGLGGGGGGGEESIFPVRALIWFLDGVHDLTGLPWWIVIPLSTLSLRIALLPVLILQLKKLKIIGEIFPKLPPPFPPLFSGKSYKDQFTLFRRERQAAGCPSFLWLLAYTSVQVPCFLLGVASIRRMSLDQYPGFDCEGILWFQNLTEVPHGVSGSIFPLLIACLHLANVQVSLSAVTLRKTSSIFGLLATLYKFYLRFLTVPILIGGFYIPQGSLVYWVSNSSLTLIQQLALRSPYVREKLGVPDMLVATKDVDEREVAAPETKVLETSEQPRQIIANELSPIELVNLSVQLLASKQLDGAIVMLRLALDKDPEYIRALVLLGQTLLQKGLLAEATEHLESAITKLSLLGQPTEVEDVDLLIISSQWAGSAYARQGKMAEGIVHLERIARLEEPQDTKSKAHYYEGLLFLASALSKDGRKAEAEKYVRILVDYDPSYSELFKDLANDDDNFVDELSDSRRKDY